jgi:hypothetical protein
VHESSFRAQWSLKDRQNGEGVNMEHMTKYKPGDRVVFGRPNGEQTEGVVVRVNIASVTVKTTEERGRDRVREPGKKWRVHPSLLRKVG